MLKWNKYFIYLKNEIKFSYFIYWYKNPNSLLIKEAYYIEGNEKDEWKTRYNANDTNEIPQTQ